MLRHLIVCTTLVLVARAPSIASTPTFAISDIPASSVSSQGLDAGIDVSTSSFVRVSASGTLTTRYGACGKFYTPAGCAGMQGALMGAFADRRDALRSGWYKIGTFANLTVPAGATRLVLRVTGVLGREVGDYHVVADAVSSATVAQLGGDSAASGVNRMIVTRRVGGTAYASTSSSSRTTASLGLGPFVPTGSTATPVRSDVQYMMRRFGFSDTPEQVTYWYTHGGPKAWLAYQLAPNSISDASLPTYVDAMPVLTGNTAIYPDDQEGTIVESRLIQQQVATQRQLLEKVTLHWLEHFAVSKYLVGSDADMNHYFETVRADALGNFAKLVSDVSKEPAMLEWLDNNYNVGNNALQPPNQNFGREVMPLYTIGLTELNLDGTPVLDAYGNPVPTYTQNDVVTSSEALTGFEIHSPSTYTGAYPAYVDKVTFNPADHYNPAQHNGAPLPTIFGHTIADPGGSQCSWNGTLPAGQAASGPCVADNLMQILATQPTTCAFEAKEMIQRFADEDPSPGYVSRVATVWCANLNAANQIALVVNAIASDPEFLESKYATVKEPIELEIDTIRALRGAKNTVSANPVVGQNIPFSFYGIRDTSGMQERIYYPPSVFSFYYPGQKESLLNNYEILSRWTAAADLANSTFIAPPATQQDTMLDLSQLAPAGGSATTSDVNRAVNYVLDALVDGGTPELKALCSNYLLNYTNSNPSASNNFQSGLRGVIWTVMTSPEYEAN